MNDQSVKTILVAEDESDLSAAIKAALEAAGFRVVVAKDGEEAWEQFQADVPDLVLLDLNMPKLGGMVVLQNIRADEHGANVPVTILTAQDDLSTVADSTVLGGMKTDFLPKADRSLEQIVAHVIKRLE